jgi:hypothetical protein
MHVDTFPVSMRVFGHDGNDFDVEGDVRVEWFPIYVLDTMHPVVVSALFNTATINGAVPSWSEMMTWQGKYFEDYRSHLEWLTTSVVNSNAD